jgi:hypothetical protein
MNADPTKSDRPRAGYRPEAHEGVPARIYSLTLRAGIVAASIVGFETACSGVRLLAAALFRHAARAIDSESKLPHS